MFAIFLPAQRKTIACCPSLKSLPADCFYRKHRMAKTSARLQRPSLRFAGQRFCAGHQSVRVPLFHVLQGPNVGALARFFTFFSVSSTTWIEQRHWGARAIFCDSFLFRLVVCDVVGRTGSLLSERNNRLTAPGLCACSEKDSSTLSWGTTFLQSGSGRADWATRETRAPRH